MQVRHQTEGGHAFPGHVAHGEKQPDHPFAPGPVVSADRTGRLVVIGQAYQPPTVMLRAGSNVACVRTASSRSSSSARRWLALR